LIDVAAPSGSRAGAGWNWPSTDRLSNWPCATTCP
jgi:hypothetical protein